MQKRSIASSLKCSAGDEQAGIAEAGTMTARFESQCLCLPVCATVLMMAGCAASSGGKVARNEADCPMSFTLTCEARRSGATTTNANCRCVRHKDIGALRRRY